jgi:hypothetical protein
LGPRSLRTTHTFLTIEMAEKTGIKAYDIKDKKSGGQAPSERAGKKRVRDASGAGPSNAPRDDDLDADLSTNPHREASTSVCKPIPELAVWLAAQIFMSCVVPLNGQIDKLRRLMGLMIANAGVKFPQASLPQPETR